jgi:hypothetical protein
MMAKNRKASYKASPLAATDVSESQELRRRKVYTSRVHCINANLTKNLMTGSGRTKTSMLPLLIVPAHLSNLLAQRRAQRMESARQLDLFADLNLGKSDEEEDADAQEDPGVVRMGIASYAPLLPSSASESPASDTRMASVSGSEPPAARKRKKRKPKSKKENFTANSKWAEQCMYAELLEMNEDNTWGISDSSADGLPEDLETAWVAGSHLSVRRS